MEHADLWITCRIAFTEVIRALGLKRGADSPVCRRFRSDWPTLAVVETDQRLVESAADLAVREGLTSLDSLHLAAALAGAGDGEPTFATWDRNLWSAANHHDLGMVPESL